MQPSVRGDDAEVRARGQRRPPRGQALPADLAERVRDRKAEIVRALTVADLANTVRYLRALPPNERQAWEDAHAHDSAAYSLLRMTTERSR